MPQYWTSLLNPNAPWQTASGTVPGDGITTAQGSYMEILPVA